MEPLRKRLRPRIVRTRAACRVDFVANRWALGLDPHLAAHPVPIDWGEPPPDLHMFPGS